MAHLAIWMPITIFGSLALMQPVKGGVIGLQWALRMHGFGGHEDEPQDVLPLTDPYCVTGLGGDRLGRTARRQITQ